MGETGHGSETLQSFQRKRGLGGVSSALSSLCVLRHSNPGRSTKKKKQRQADGGGGGARSEILPQSPAQSTGLFSSGRGGGWGERRKHQ